MIGQSSNESKSQAKILAQQREKWSKLLQLSQNWYSTSKNYYYQEFEKTIQLLKQILQLSKTEVGREKISKIQSRFISYWITWSRCQYWQIDNLYLSILVNLTTDLRFAQDAIQYRSRLLDLRSVDSNNFKRLLNQSIENIDTLKIKLKESNKGSQKYSQHFSSQKQAERHLQQHLDFFNFPSSPFYEQDYEQYVGMLAAALKVGAKDAVTNMFPKECFGCVLYTMVMTGYQTKQKGVAMKFLQQYTKRWFTSQLYQCLLSKMKTLYRDIKRNEKLTDRHELVCLRFHQSKYTSSVFQYLQKLGRKARQDKLHLVPRIEDRDDFEYQLKKLKYSELKNQRLSEIQQKLKQPTSKQAPQFLSTSKLLPNPSPLHEHLQTHLLTLIPQPTSISKTQLAYKPCIQTYRYRLHKFFPYGASNHIFLFELENGKIFCVCLFSHSRYQGDKSQTLSSIFVMEIQSFLNWQCKNIEDSLFVKVGGFGSKIGQKNKEPEGKMNEEKQQEMMYQRQRQRQRQRRRRRMGDSEEQQQYQYRYQEKSRRGRRSYQTYLIFQELQQKLQMQPIVLQDIEREKKSTETKEPSENEKKDKKEKSIDQLQLELNLTESSEDEEKTQNYFEKKYKNKLEIGFRVEGKQYKLMVSLKASEQEYKQKTVEFANFMKKYQEENETLLKCRRFEVFRFKLQKK